MTYYHIWSETKQEYLATNYDIKEEIVDEIIDQQEKHPNDNLKIYKSKDYIE